MNYKILFVSGVTLFVGVGVGYLFGTRATLPITMPQEDSTHGTMHSAMSGMTESLQGKTGDEFDKTFLSEMIVHHEGAVAMAKLALLHSAHAEVKAMAEVIISAQTTEIEQMKSWQKMWYAGE